MNGGPIALFLMQVGENLKEYYINDMYNQNQNI